MRAMRLVAVALTGLVLAACGSDDSAPHGAGRAWTLDQVLRLSGLRRNADGLTYALPSYPDCVVRVLLRTTAEVETYKASGDVLATNPDRSAGAIVDPGRPSSCNTVLTRAFAHVR